MFGKIEGENHSLISADEKIEYKLLRISQNLNFNLNIVMVTTT